MAVTDLIEEYLLVWVLLAVAVGVAVPRIAVLTRLSIPILAVMIGSISLTLTIAEFRSVRPRSVVLILLGHVMMPVVAFGVARLLGLSATLTVGFVILAAVTPELVTPVMTELAGGKTALATVALVLIGFGSVGFTPAAVVALGGGIEIATDRIVEQLAVAVVGPMGVAIGARTRWPERIGQYEGYYPSISAVMVVLIIGAVTAANADVLRAGGWQLLSVGIGAGVVNVTGYAVGWTLARNGSRSDRIATMLSVGMRDFAVAAALIVAAGLPTVAALPAIVFGIVEMTSSAGLVRYLTTAAPSVDTDS
ncbi:MAG: bile acid:sodium symporter family protein [Halobacteriales archaeon]